MSELKWEAFPDAHIWHVAYHSITQKGSTMWPFSDDETLVVF